MVMVAGTTELLDEKRRLSLKLNKEDYPEREADLKRFGDVEKELREITQRFLQNAYSNVVEKTIPQMEKVKTLDMKTAKKLLKQKYEDYRQITIQSRELTDELVEKKKEGRDLMERIVKNNGETDKKLIEDILKF